MLFLASTSLLCISTLLIHTLIAWASQIGFFYSIVVHPFLFEKTFQFSKLDLLSFDIFSYFPLSVFTLPWELFFPYFRVLDLLFSYLIFNVHCLAAWWAQVDSNHRPCAYQAHALTTWAMSPYTHCLSYLYLGSYLLLVPAVAFRLVEMTGLEPVNPLLAKQVLSQLSYTPMVSCKVFPKTLKIEQRSRLPRFLPLSRTSRFHHFVVFFILLRISSSYLYSL